MMKFFSSWFTFFVVSLVGMGLVISGDNWFVVWVGFELSLLSFLPMFSGSRVEVEGLIKYFLVQVGGSSVFALSFLLPNCSFTLSLFLLSMFMKLGLFPFHGWVPLVMSSVTWGGCFILTTLQKVGPLFVVCGSASVSSSVLLGFGVFTVFIGGTLGYRQSNMRLLMAYSSISHGGWMVVGFVYSFNVFLFYIFVYFSLLVVLFSFLKFNKMVFSECGFKVWGFVNLLVFSLFGVPPFSMIFNKLVSNRGKSMVGESCFTMKLPWKPFVAIALGLMGADLPSDDESFGSVGNCEAVTPPVELNDESLLYESSTSGNFNPTEVAGPSGISDPLLSSGGASNSNVNNLDEGRLVVKRKSKYAWEDWDLEGECSGLPVSKEPRGCVKNVADWLGMDMSMEDSVMSTDPEVVGNRSSNLANDNLDNSLILRGEGMNLTIPGDYSHHNDSSTDQGYEGGLRCPAEMMSKDDSSLMELISSKGEGSSRKNDPSLDVMINAAQFENSSDTQVMESRDWVGDVEIRTNVESIASSAPENFDDYLLDVGEPFEVYDSLSEMEESLQDLDERLIQMQEEIESVNASFGASMDDSPRRMMVEHLNEKMAVVQLERDTLHENINKIISDK